MFPSFVFLTRIALNPSGKPQMTANRPKYNKGTRWADLVKETVLPILALLNVKPLPFHSNLHINLNSNHWSHVFRSHKSSLSRACNKQRTPEAENQNSPTNSIHILNAAVYTRCWKEANTLFRLPYLHDKSVNLLYILRLLRTWNKQTETTDIHKHTSHKLNTRL